MSSKTASLGSLADDLEDKADREDDMSVGDLMEVAGQRGIALFILLPALVGASPVGMVPGVPTLMAVIVALFAVQIAMGRKDMWLPSVLKSRAVDSDKFAKGVSTLKPYLNKADGYFGRRLTVLTGDDALRLTAGLIIILCALVPPLELVPGAALLPLLAIAAFGVALTLRDGVLMVVAATISLGAAYFGLTAL